jgi:hypothetical protein
MDVRQCHNANEAPEVIEMAALTKPNTLTMDDDLCELIARDVTAHHHRAEKRHFAETGTTGPIDEERETADEVIRLLKLANPGLDGDERAAIERLKAALEGDVAVAHG